MDNQIFVKIEEYDEVLNIVKLIKEKLAKANETIGKISELKAQEEQEIQFWNKNIDEVSKNIEAIETTVKEKSE